MQQKKQNNSLKLLFHFFAAAWYRSKLNWNALSLTLLAESEWNIADTKSQCPMDGLKEREKFMDRTFHLSK